MDTIRLIKINDTQLYIEINSDKNSLSKKIEVNFKVEQIKSLSQKISNDIIKDYVKNGIQPNQLNHLKELSFELFNIIDCSLLAHVAAGIHANYQGNENYISNSKLIETVKNIIKK